MPQPWQRQRLRRLWEMLRRLALLHLAWPRPPWVPRRLMRTNLQPTRLGHWQLHRLRQHLTQPHWHRWLGLQQWWYHPTQQKTPYPLTSWLKPQWAKPCWSHWRRPRPRQGWPPILRRFLRHPKRWLLRQTLAPPLGQWLGWPQEQQRGLQREPPQLGQQRQVHPLAPPLPQRALQLAWQRQPDQQVA